MPTLIWNSPVYDQMVHQTVIDLITDFNAKLLEIGLIDITSLNSTNISTIPNTVGATIPTSTRIFDLCTLTYALPTGNGNIIYDNSLSTNEYKVIQEASYDSTSVYLKFNFQYYSYNISNAYTINSANGIASHTIRCGISISLNNGLTYYSVCNWFGRTTASSYPDANANIQFPANFISLTRNHLFINALVIQKNTQKHSDVSSQYARTKGIISFSLYRNNGSVQIMYPNSLSDDVSNTNTGYYQATGFDVIKDNNVQPFTTSSLWSFPWKFNRASIINNKIQLDPIYCILPNIFGNDPGVWVTKINDSAENYQLQDFIINLNDVPTKLKFMVFAGYNPWWKPMVGSSMTNNQQHSFAFLFDNYPCTTALL